MKFSKEYVRGAARRVRELLERRPRDGWRPVARREHAIRAVKRLERHNEWRRGADTEQADPAQLGRDIELVCAIARYAVASGAWEQMELAAAPEVPCRDATGEEGEED